MDFQPFRASERVGLSETVPLRNVFLHVTKACNLYCHYCYFSARKPLPDELTTDDFTRLWPSLVAVRPQKVVLTGGEPLLRPDILDLLRGLKAADPEHHSLRCLNTNGHLVTAELARALVGLADEVRVSLDGLRERNDAQRGAGNFEAALRALDTYYAVGFEPKVLITVTAQSLPDLEELLVYLVSRRFTRINLNGFRTIGRGQGHSDWKADPQAVQASVARAWRRCYPDQPLPANPPEPGSCANCGVGQFLNIMPNGDVFPCHVLTEPEFRIGNIRDQDLVAICSKQGLLGQLADLNFKELAAADPTLVALNQPSVCLGPIYRDTKMSSVWHDKLRKPPLIPVAAIE